MKDRIIWGLIGCGDVTEVKNGPGLYLAEHSELKGVWNRTHEKAVSWTERHGHGIVYDTVDEMLADPEIDIVYVATTPDTHYEFAMRCAKAGKHCLVEKPVAPTLEEGLRMQEAFDEAGKRCYIAFYRRCMSRYRRLSEILASGEIGEVTGVQILYTAKAISDPNAWRANPQICGGDVFTETGIHMLDIVQMLLGSIESASCEKDPESVSYSVSARFSSGKVLNGLWNYRAGVPTDRVVVLGTEGMIEFVFGDNAAPFRITGNNGIREESVPVEKHVGLPMEQEIVNELLGTGHFTGTLENSLETLAITSGAYYGS